MRNSKRLWTFVAIAAAVLVVVGAVAWWAVGIVGSSTNGKTQAEAGARYLIAQDATKAVASFRDASASFGWTRSMLGPDWLAGAVGRIPMVGDQFAAMRTLSEIGLDGSAAGAEIASALRDAPATTDSPNPVARFASVFAAERKHVDAALASLNRAAGRARSLDETGLVGPLARVVGPVKAGLQEVAPFLGKGRSLVQLAAYLASSPHRVLIVSQDGAELRPAGGFTGSYGTLQVGPGGIKLDYYKDVYKLPYPTVHVDMPPGARMAKDFTFHDANWWIDFPTSARTMLGFWDGAQQPPVDGLVAVDTVAVKEIVGALGSVHLASYDQTFTADGLLEKLLQQVEVVRINDNEHKALLIALAGEIERRILAASPAELGRIGAAVVKAADQKHIQFYFKDPTAEAAVRSLGWSGSIAPPAGTTDFLAVSNAMNAGSKVNLGVKKVIDYQVALRPAQSAETTLVLWYSNTAPFGFAIPGPFSDYLRVYRRAGTAIAPSTVDNAQVTTDLGLPTAVREFLLWRGDSRVETITSTVPQAWRTPTGASRADLGHYRLFLVRQDDLEDVPTKVVMTAPPGWSVKSAAAHFVSTGHAVPVTVTGTQARVSVALSGDLVVDLTLAPAR